MVDEEAQDAATAVRHTMPFGSEVRVAETFEDGFTLRVSLPEDPADRRPPVTLLCGCEGVPCAENRTVEDGELICGACDGPCHPYVDDE